MAEEQLVEEAAKELDEFVKTTYNTLIPVALIAGIGIGFAAGYYFAERRLKTKYEKIANDDIEEMRERYLAKTKDVEEKKPLDEVMADYGYETKLEGPDEVVWVKVDPRPEADEDAVEPDPDSSVDEFQTRNVFTHDDNWNYEVELAHRSADVPYVIHRDEYFNNETPYEQITLTYYEGDDVLADSNDTPVDDQDAMVGLGNLAKFGHGSNDPNTVYVRNHELGLEIEIVHSDGKFATEVHGFSDDELRHSDRRHRTPRKYDDE